MKLWRIIIVFYMFCLLSIQVVYAESGFILETMEVDVPEILWGRYPEAYDDDEIRVAEIVFMEKECGEWQVEDGIVFTMPEGVKLRGAEINTIGLANGKMERDRLVNSNAGPLAKAGIRDSVWGLSDQEVEGHGLTRENDGVAGVRVQLWVSVIPDYEGDISVGVRIDGIEVADKVVARVIPPFVIENKQTYGFDSMSTKQLNLEDITIIEKREGAIKTNEEGNEVLIVGMEYIPFEHNSAIVTVIEGDLEIGELFYKNHFFGQESSNSDFTKCLFIEIAKESTIPSTILISGMTAPVGRRTYPKGDIALRIGGGVIGNFGGFAQYKYASFNKAYSSFHSPIYYYGGENDIRDFLKIQFGCEEMWTNDDVPIPLPVAPYYNEYGSLMVPLRVVADSLGVEIMWNNESKLINIYTYFAEDGKIVYDPSNHIVNNTAMINLWYLCTTVLRMPSRWDDATETAYVSFLRD